MLYTKSLLYYTAYCIKDYFCQAQGPTPGPTQGQVKVKVKVKVRTWSGQVMSGQTQTPTLTQKWDLSYTLLYTISK